MNTKEKLVINISDFDNRWNKVAIEIAREHLNPSTLVKPKEKSFDDRSRCHELPANGSK
jgi:hypothetical protein